MRPPRVVEIGVTFLLIGLLAFGGQAGLLALLNRNLVDDKGWLGTDEITEAFTYVQLLPGAVVVQVVAYLGWKLRRAVGAAVATCAFLLPSVVVMLVLAATYGRLATMAGVSAALGGLTAAVVGLLAVGAAKQARKSVVDISQIGIAASVFCGSVFFHLNPAIMIVLAGVVGILGEIIHARQTAAGGETPTARSGGN